jgi:hypothetical protein
MKRLLLLGLCLLGLTAHFIADSPARDWLGPRAVSGGLPADNLEPPGQCEAQTMGFIGPRVASIAVPTSIVQRLEVPAWRCGSQRLSPQLPPPKAR